MNVTPNRVALSDNDAALLAQASRLISGTLNHSRAHRVALVQEKVNGGEVVRLEVPAATMRLLSQTLALAAQYQDFLLYPEPSELTSKQAAEVLGVSRLFLIRLLDSGEIPHRKVGHHRRVLMKDVLVYKATMRAKRKAALDELAELNEKLGGYDLR